MNRRVLTFLSLLSLPLAALALAAEAPPAAPPAWTALYHQVAGGEEEYHVQKGENLTFLALHKGVQWNWLAVRNQLKKPYRLKAGMVLKINNTHIVPTELRDGFVINLPEKLLYYFRDGVYQRRYALAVGKRTWPTPTGDYHIRNKAKNPTWTVPESIQEEMEEQGREVLEKVPPGPKNPLGSYWMGTSAPGVGLHATNIPWSVGNSVSHGCMRMLPDEISELYPQVEVGTPVKIIYRPLKMARTAEGRIYLEAHPNIYHYTLKPQAWVEEVARVNGIQGLLDWDKVAMVLKAKEGVAFDVTRDPGTRTAESREPSSKKQSN